jgi:hypothetical protein
VGRADLLAECGAAHLAAKRAAGEWPAIIPETAAQAATYHSVFGGDE